LTFAFFTFDLYSTVQECDATTDAITIYSGVHKKF